MPEYVVDCEQLPYGDGMTIVLPISINGHVHERVVRCKDCRHCTPIVITGRAWLVCDCRPDFCHITEGDSFCSHGEPRAGDG